jgi:YD repeat-containing protein
MTSLTPTLFKKSSFTIKTLLALFVTLLALTAVMPTQAYDQPWNGNREDITGIDNTNEDDDCPEGGCPPEPDCNVTQSPVYSARGYLVYTENDIAFANNVSRVHLKRTYNSFDRRAGLFGRGWVTPQEINIARTYKAVTEGNVDGSPKTATEFESVPIFLTEYGRRYKLTETETTCTAPGVLYFSFEKLPDGTFKQVFDQDNDTATFSANGLMLASYSDEAGTTIYYDYDDQSRLIRQIDSDGFALNFSYNEQGFVAQVTDQAGRAWNYSYDDSGNLMQQSDPEGSTKDYSYQTIDNIGYQQSLLTSITDNIDDPRLSVTWSEVLLYGKKAQRVSSYTEEDGRRHSYTYAQSSVSGVPTVRVTKTTRQVNSSAVIETQVFEANRDTYQIVSAVNTTDSTQVAKTYNERSKLISLTDRRGNTTEYTYNDAGRMTSKVELAGTGTAKTTTMSYWNDTDRITAMNEYGSRETRYTYDAHLRMLTQTGRDLVANLEREWTYTYHPNVTDAQGNVRLGQVASIDGPQVGAQDTTTYEYNAQGLVTRINYPLNQSESYTYSLAGQLATMTDINGIITEFSYNSRNQLIQTVRNSRTIQYAYNGQNQLTQITDALGRQLIFSYDSHNQLNRVVFPSGDYFASTYDYQPNRTEVATRYYQADDTLISTDIAYQHPESGLTEQDFIISTSNTVSERRYNALDELIEHTRIGDFSGASRATSTYVYDQEGRLSTINDALNGLTQWSYDTLDRVTQIFDANNANTEYRYTAWNELVELDSPDTGTTTRQLDTAGNVTQHTNANNQQTLYRYDAQNRLSEVDYQGDDLDVALSYDQGSYGQGRLTAVIDGSGSSDYQYDDRGLITQANATIAGVSLNTAYQYNDANQLTQISYPNGGAVKYSYDVAGRLSAVQRVDNTTTTAIISNISWHGPTVNKYQQGNGVETQWTYDAAGRLIGKQFDSASNQFQQQLDNQGQITQQVWARAGSDRAENFEYDLLGRLNSDGSADATLSQLFSYDSVGNRLSQQLDTDTTNYNYEANSNRQSAINTTTIQLDAAGVAYQIAIIKFPKLSVV